MKRRRHVTATELAECCICEQRVVFDQTRGRRRSTPCQQRMQAGVAAHAALHRQALRDGADTDGQGSDERCFIASAVWGTADPRTRSLRAWRDQWLLKRRWGRGFAAAYYAVSPWLVRLMRSCPPLRAAGRCGLGMFVRWLERRRNRWPS